MALLAGLFVVTTVSTAALAQGTHFFAEAELGVAMPLGAEMEQAGMAVGLTAGMGGKVPGTIVRGYLLGEFMFSNFRINRCGEEGLARELSELALGARLLIPIYDSIRVYADVLLASAWLSSQERDEYRRLYWVEDIDPRLATIFSVGLQFRPMSLLSVGARVDFQTLLDQSELLEEEVEGRLSVLGTVALHF